MTNRNQRQTWSAAPWGVMRRVRSHGGNRCKRCGTTRELGACRVAEGDGVGSFMLVCRRCHEEEYPPLVEAVASPAGEYPTIEEEYPPLVEEYPAQEEEYPPPVEYGPPAEEYEGWRPAQYLENAGGWNIWVYGGAPAPWQH